MNCFRLTRLTNCSEKAFNFGKVRFFSTPTSSNTPPPSPPSPPSLPKQQEINGTKDSQERTMILVKPDAIQRRLVSRVLERFESRGFKLIGMKLVMPSEEFWRGHYPHVAKKSFFPYVLKYLQSGPVITMVWEGKDVIKQGRLIVGEKDPLRAGTGTIRGDYGITVGRNLAHRSDSLESSDKEIAMWFNENEIFEWEDPLFDSLYESEEN